jgi:hypothetical protein
MEYTDVDTGASLTNLDPFVSTRYAALSAGSTLTNWIVRPTRAEALSKLKVQSGSNQSLLQFVEDGITVAGLPVLTSTHVDANTVAWGVDSTQLRYVLRKGTTVERFPSVTNDGQWVRAISRVGVGYLNESGIVRLMLTPISFTVTLANGSSGETFTLKVDGVATGTIAYDAAASAVKTAIVAVDDGIEAADVTVSGSPGAFTVTLPAVLTAGTPTGDLTVTVAVA